MKKEEESQEKVIFDVDKPFLKCYDIKCANHPAELNMDH